MKFVITGIVESKTEADEINKVAKVFDNIFIRGTLRHRQHEMVSMGNVWHKVVKNTAGRSWGASGNVD